MSATANDILTVARSQLGIKEMPAGSNNVKYNTAYYGRAVRGDSFPWCCAFVWWVFQQVCPSLFYGGDKTAYCPALEIYAKNHGQWVTSGYRPGDCVLFDFHGGGKGLACHIGIIECISNTGIICIEGNTSVSSNDNGGCVMRRTRYLSQILGAFRPNYAEPNKESEDSEMLSYDQFKAYMDKYSQEKAASAGYAEEQAAMAKAKGKGIMDGTRPDSPLTRGEYAITLDRRGALD